MEYERYKGVRDMTWKLLIDCNVRMLPVDVGAICARLGIRVVSYSRGKRFMEAMGIADHAERNDGFLVRSEDHEPIVFYNQACTVGRRRFTVAHELGHIVLGHSGHLVNREPEPTDNPIEQAANSFAARLLAPACVMWALGVHRPEDIAQLCNISLQSARYRAERMEKLYERDRCFMEERGYSCFQLSPYEQKVYKQFEPFIKDHRGYYSSYSSS